MKFGILVAAIPGHIVEAAPTIDEVAWMCDAARVSTQVASHRSDLPSLQGMSVIPSGLLPSLLAKPIGSNTAVYTAYFCHLDQDRTTTKRRIALVCPCTFLANNIEDCVQSAVFPPSSIYTHDAGQGSERVKAVIVFFADQTRIGRLDTPLTIWRTLSNAGLLTMFDHSDI
ncbi:jg14758 [Pararge aegeria aegeria]|uniref:Jg14758 protein n=1 Tax=Pararge aegeria aegeria TaxID=348720 RepID=A0A8S4SF40_9NEOP|nr:jg14758 [Pararge aegeria aegeria]